MYDVFWSDRILDEMSRNLVEEGLMKETGAARLKGAMRAAFDAAVVPAETIAQLEPVMTNHPKDRHVLAAAVVVHAEVVVTANLKDFSEEACSPLGVSAVHPDEFLVTLQAKRPQVVLDVLEEQAGDLKNPPWTLEDLLGALGKQVPEFVRAVQTHRARTST